MTTKEKIVRQSIEAVTKEIAEIQALFDANPLVEIIEVRKAAQALLNDYQPSERIKPEFMEKLGALVKREKELFAIADKRQDTLKLIDRQVELEIELGDLNNELYSIEWKKERTSKA